MPRYLSSLLSRAARVSGSSSDLEEVFMAGDLIEIVPGGDTSKYFSVLTETSYSKFKPLPEGDFGKAVVDGLVAEGILQPSDLPLIETVFLIHAGHSYPIPSIDRNAALDEIHAYLEPRNIFSRGRFTIAGGTLSVGGNGVTGHVAYTGSSPDISLLNGGFLLRGKNGLLAGASTVSTRAS